MKTQAPNPMSFLTEGEQRIAEQVRKLRDLQARRHVSGGTGRQQSQSFRTLAAKTGVKDSHDR